MDLVNWFSLLLVCLLGATMPGASLIVVLQSVMVGGRRRGLLTAIAHAVAVGIYAFMAAFGLALLIQNHPDLLLSIRVLGALFLIGMAATILVQHAAINPGGSNVHSPFESVLRGFLVAFLNPKLAIFFVALFSQFIRPNDGWAERGLMAVTAMSVDAFWYMTVVLFVSQPRLLRQLQEKSAVLSKLFAAIILVFALSMLFSLVI